MLVAPRIPDSTRLQPAEILRWTIRLRLPLREWHAYDGLPTKDAVPVTVTTIRYKLESLRESACRHHQEHVNFPGIFKARGYPSDKAEVTVMLPEPIVLLRRSAQFQRF